MKRPSRLGSVDRGWLLVVEYGADPSPWLDNRSPRPGQAGHCVRSDGPHGPLSHLIPRQHGWQLIDFGFDIASHDNTVVDRIYLLADTRQVSSWPADVHGANRWMLDPTRQRLVQGDR